jgi:hypothetical protein
MIYLSFLVFPDIFLLTLSCIGKLTTLCYLHYRPIVFSMWLQGYSPILRKHDLPAVRLSKTFLEVSWGELRGTFIHSYQIYRWQNLQSFEGWLILCRRPCHSNCNCTLDTEIFRLSIVNRYNVAVKCATITPGWFHSLWFWCLLQCHSSFHFHSFSCCHVSALLFHIMIWLMLLLQMKGLAAHFCIIFCQGDGNRRQGKCPWLLGTCVLIALCSVLGTCRHALWPWNVMIDS